MMIFLKMRTGLKNVLMVITTVLATLEPMFCQKILIYENSEAKHNCVSFKKFVFEGDLLCWEVLADFNGGLTTMALAIDIGIKRTESDNFETYCETNVLDSQQNATLCYCKSKNRNGSFNFIVTKNVTGEDNKALIKAKATDLQEKVIESNHLPLPEIRKKNDVEIKPDVKPVTCKDGNPHEKWFYIMCTIPSISVLANIFLLLLIFWLNRNMKEKFQKILTENNEQLEIRIIEALREISHEKKEQLEKRIAAVSQDMTEEIIDISTNRRLLPFMEQICQHSHREDNTEPLPNHQPEELFVDVHQRLLSGTISTSSV